MISTFLKVTAKPGAVLFCTFIVFGTEMPFLMNMPYLFFFEKSEIRILLQFIPPVMPLVLGPAKKSGVLIFSISVKREFRLIKENVILLSHLSNFGYENSCIVALQ